MVVQQVHNLWVDQELTASHCQFRWVDYSHTMLAYSDPRQQEVQFSQLIALQSSMSSDIVDSELPVCSAQIISFCSLDTEHFSAEC